MFPYRANIHHRLTLMRQLPTPFVWTPANKWPNTLRPRQKAAIFQTTFSNAFSWMKIYQFRLEFPINTIPSLNQIMDWRRLGDKPLSKPMMISLPMHLCVTWPRWVSHRNTCLSINFLHHKRYCTAICAMCTIDKSKYVARSVLILH